MLSTIRIAPWASMSMTNPVKAWTVPAAAAKRKLNFKESRELEQLPALIDTLETRIATMTAQMNEPAFYQRDAAAINAHNAALAATQVELEAAIGRWSELEA